MQELCLYFVFSDYYFFVCEGEQQLPAGLLHLAYGNPDADGNTYTDPDGDADAGGALRKAGGKRDPRRKEPRVVYGYYRRVRCCARGVRSTEKEVDRENNFFLSFALSV